MSISGPCFCPIKNGVPFNKYEVVLTTRTLKGIVSELWYFDTEEDAEIMVAFLKQKKGLAEIEAVLGSRKRSREEKSSYKDLLDSLDTTTLPNKVKTLHFTHKKVFVEARKKH